MVEADIQTICQWKDAEIDEINSQLDHVHSYDSFDTSKVVGFRFYGNIKRKNSHKIDEKLPRFKTETILG